MGEPVETQGDNPHGRLKKARAVRGETVEDCLDPPEELLS